MLGRPAPRSLLRARAALRRVRLADPAECVHCGRALPAGTWLSGDAGPACFGCLVAREDTHEGPRADGR